MFTCTGRADVEPGHKHVTVRQLLTAWEATCACVCTSGSVSVTDTLSSGRPQRRSVQRSMQDSLSMVESCGKVIPGLSMIKLTPHRVSQIRFCALDTATGSLFNAVSRSVSPVVLTSLHCNYSEWERECIRPALWEEDWANVISFCPGRLLSLSLSLSLPLSCVFDFKQQLHQLSNHSLDYFFLFIVHATAAPSLNLCLSCVNAPELLQNYSLS